MKHVVLAAALIAGLVGATGCIRSRVVITSEPSGALITMNGKSLGTTPTERPFMWYWYYDFEAKKEGYEVAKERRRFHAPVYFWFPFDFFAELMPFNIYSTKHVNLVMTPLRSLPEPAMAEEIKVSSAAPETPKQ